MKGWDCGQIAEHRPSSNRLGSFLVYNYIHRHEHGEVR